jgi:hypothetical protein
MFKELMPLLTQRTLMITVARIDDKVIRANFIPSKGDGKTASNALTHSRSRSQELRKNWIAIWSRSLLPSVVPFSRPVPISNGSRKNTKRQLRQSRQKTKRNSTRKEGRLKPATQHWLKNQQTGSRV